MSFSSRVSKAAPGTIAPLFKSALLFDFHAAKLVIDSNLEMSAAKYVKKLDAGEAFHIDQDVDRKVSFARKHSRREKLLFAALVIFIAVAVAFIVLYVKQISTENKVDAGGKEIQTKPSSKPSSKSCLSPDCVLISSGK